MDFLKEILGDDLFNQVSTAINAWNDNDDIVNKSAFHQHRNTF